MRLKAGVSALVAIMAVAACVSAPVSAEPTAKLDAGVVQGETIKDLVVFKGIPFAAAPAGKLRWRAPQPVSHWDGVRPATAFGAACPQPHVSDEPWARVGPQSEDCLYLNVWRPAKAEKLPVMVFIHGGSFRAGSGGVPLYDGGALAKRGAVIVTINYRLGRLGFFAHPALSKENTDGLLANYGLMDQIEALRWVKHNIAQFGGDAGNVTIFGESAGGVSVQALMASPEANGLFHRAISESGGGFSVAPTLKAGETAGQQWAAKQGLQDATPDQLRALPVDKVATAEALTGAVIDGRVLKDSPAKSFVQKTQANVPLMIGGNSNEFSLGGLTLAANLTLGGAYKGLLAEYKAAPQTRVGAEGDLAIQAVAIQPSRYLAERQAAKGQKAYTYYFTQQPASERAIKPGSEHGGELSYLFGTKLNAETWDAADEKVSKLMGDYWVNFAKTGDPNGNGAPKWEPVTASSSRYLTIDANARMSDFTPLENKVHDAGVASATRIWGPAQ
ncbi:MAG TPA: carboxylesterase family protein [Hyphomonadaceae bacterium]|nr:carboxylesterase family protein [Hyphomonadaceae bacterium]